MIDLQNISVQFGGRYLFNDVNLRINAGDKFALVGANGTGKSTLLKVILGEVEPESGEIQKQRRISIGYLPQEQVTHTGKTLLEEASSALTDIITLQEKEKEITQKIEETEDDEIRNDLVYQLGDVHHRLEDLDSYGATAKIEKILLGLGFKVSDFGRLTDEFSGGWQMRIALAKILISQNDILLLDEPTNHLDIESLQWLVSFLKAFEGSILMVSHDRYFVNEITNKTLEISLGKFFQFNGKFDAYVEQKRVREEQLEQQFIQQQKKMKETERFIERFRYKNTKAKQVQSRIKQLEKMEMIELPESASEIRLRFPDAPRSGRVTIEMKGVDKAYGNNVVFENLDFKIERGEKIAFVGPNGAGKTTLSKIIANRTEIQGGEITLGSNVSISYYAQEVAELLNPELDMIESMMESGEDYTLGQLRGILGSFLFSGDDVFKKIKVLSGGEKSRIALAKLLLSKSNLLILDEPTNHLDFQSKQILQRALIEFGGSLVLVSHDIDFLKPVANKVVEIQPGNVKEYLGGIEYFIMKKEEQKNASAVDSTSVGTTTVSTVNRKDQKRLEAEKRQQRFIATKDLVKNIEKLEIEIAELEEKEKHFETELADEEIYSKPELAKQKNQEYKETQEKLSGLMEKWETLTEKLQEIESQFE